MVDSIEEIKPIIDDIKLDIKRIIESIAKTVEKKKQEKYKDKKNTLAAVDNMSKSIGSMVAEAIIKRIQGKIIMPLVNEGVSSFVDKSLLEFQKVNKQLLSKYCTSKDNNFASQSKQKVKKPIVANDKDEYSKIIQTIKKGETISNYR